MTSSPTAFSLFSISLLQLQLFPTSLIPKWAGYKAIVCRAVDISSTYKKNYHSLINEESDMLTILLPNLIPSPFGSGLGMRLVGLGMSCPPSTHTI